MDTEGWMFGGFMAEQERLRVARQSHKERAILKDQYDQWCIDHGIPPPPDYGYASNQFSQGGGSSAGAWIVGGLIFFVLVWLLGR